MKLARKNIQRVAQLNGPPCDAKGRPERKHRANLRFESQKNNESALGKAVFALRYSGR